MNRSLPRPQRRRQCPSQFSWVDQRLARDRYFARASAPAWQLYLFLVTVADAQGTSYYAERTLCVHLGSEPSRLRYARQELISLDLIAYQAPIYQVLSLAQAPASRPTPSEAKAQIALLRQALK